MDIELRLLSDFELRVDRRPVELSLATQRVLALLAVRGRPQLRSSVAATLWIDSSQDRASANLRSALWKLRDLRETVLDARSKHLQLGPEVSVDVGALVQCARRLIEAQRFPVDEGECLVDLDVRADLFNDDLLPDWDEDWILFERERLRQLRMHAMEALTARLRREGRYAEAVDAGLSAIAADPLRESAHRALIDVYLAEGNVVDAKRQLDRYRQVLWDELGLMPSADLCELLGTMPPTAAPPRPAIS